MNNRIWLSLAHMSGREQDFIKEAFDTNWVVPLGPNVDAFEKSLSEYLNEERHVVALSAGTAALHLGLILFGVKPGDEIICQSFTFAASANPIVYLGAKPVFVDSEKDTWNMDPVLLNEAIKDRLRKTGKLPKVIIPVHLYGMPAKIDQIMEIANYYNIPVLEDAAEALGAVFDGQKCGTFGELAALSFNGNKMITTSGGGALVCRTEEEAKRTKFYATQARDAAPHYQHTHIGYNYRMSNICAGIGRGQMFVLDEHITRRREIHGLYTKLLKNVPGISVLQNFNDHFNSNFWLTCILVDSEIAGKTREDIRLKLDAENIETRPLWKPMHLQPVFADAPFYGNGTSEYLFNIGLCLPSSPTLTDEDIIRVVECIKLS
ncbi:aminotransferase class I/II-fold pyridoxal phosphate-dependent enzyme [Oscillospiraceae bacterium N12]|jgi:dTDP-4-amino-4,6-dideoxygalactose transaminase|uniref:Aminotransferase class I/II-fold pyridoxal phosphate-dependent enzyme n=1 Tax=Jilunia laotingensis TaxID=2763675 RepID=A0A926F4J4_9BACT|nr:aminotransferase class I/II-fold pyridoxal phosphate-dependent enzyme [Jilunia laotingensis]MBC8591847.1 aminotransferase class I/II-fold pyridoxal phosphate-dependent enzyme [Jilunia laotingensis]